MHLCVYTRACDGVCLNYFAIYCATETSYVKNMRTGDGGCRSERETEMRLQQLLCCFFFLASHWLTSSSRTYCVRRRNARGRPLWHHIALLLALNRICAFFKDSRRLFLVYSSQNVITGVLFGGIVQENMHIYTLQTVTLCGEKSPCKKWTKRKHLRGKVQ